MLSVTFSEFLSRYWTWAPDQHVTLIGPTNCGKTTLGMNLIPECLKQNPDVHALVLVMKPHVRRKRGSFRNLTGDPTVLRYVRKHKAKIIRSWPPSEPLWSSQRNFVLWPKHKFDASDEARHAAIFQDALLGCYRQGGWVIFGDELFSLVNELGLRRDLIRVWSKGRSMETTLIGGTQRPREVPLWAYSMAEHLFLWYDPDREARKRFSEIGGFDPKMIERITSRLPKHTCLYLKRSNREACIITPDP